MQPPPNDPQQPSEQPKTQAESPTPPAPPPTNGSGSSDNIQISISRKQLKAAGLMAAMLAIGIAIGFGASNTQLFNQGPTKPQNKPTQTNTTTDTSTTTGTGAETSTTAGDTNQSIQIQDAVEKPKEQINFQETLSNGKKMIALGFFDQGIFYLDQALSVDSKSADAYHLRGLGLFQTNQNQEALRDFDAALSIDNRHRDTLLDRAALFFKTGEMQKALADYQAILSNNSNDADAIYGMSLCQRKLGDSNKALSQLRQLVSSNPSYANAYIGVGTILFDRGEFPQAKAAFAAGLQQDSKNGQLYANRARASFQLRDYTKAAEDFTKAITYEPAKPEFLNDRGFCHYLSGKPESAIDDFKSVRERKADFPLLRGNMRLACTKTIEKYLNMLRSDRNNPRIYSRLANAYLYLPDLNAAFKNASAAVRLDPNDPVCHHILGRYWAEKKEYKKAVDCYSKAISLNSEFWGAYFDRAYTEVDLEMWQAALDDNTKYLTKYPNNTAALNNRSLSYKALKQYDKAEQDLNQALSFDPNNPIYLGNLGRTLLLARRYEEAVRALNRQIQLTPDKPAYYTRGEANYNWGKYEAAAKDFERELAKSKDPATYYWLGQCKMELNKYDEALTAFTDGIKQDPKASYNYLEAGKALVRQKKSEEALPYLQKVKELEPKATVSYTNLIDCLSNLQKYDEAVAVSEELIKLYPDKAAGYYWKGNTLFDEGKCAESLAMMEEALKRNKEWDNVHWLAAYNALIMKDWKKCLSYCESYNKIDTDASPNNIFLGVLLPWYSYKSLGDNKNADETLVKGSARFKENTWPRPILDYIARAQTPETLMAKAVDRDKETEARTWIGITQILKGDKAKAKENFEWVAKNGTPTYNEMVQARAFLKEL